MVFWIYNSVIVCSSGLGYTLLKLLAIWWMSSAKTWTSMFSPSWIKMNQSPRLSLPQQLLMSSDWKRTNDHKMSVQSKFLQMQFDLFSVSEGTLFHFWRWMKTLSIPAVWLTWWRGIQTRTRAKHKSEIKFHGKIRENVHQMPVPSHWWCSKTGYKDHQMSELFQLDHTC